MLGFLVLLATSVPLGVWPEQSGPAASVVGNVEFYLVEPDEDYWILAVQPLLPPLAAADRAALVTLVTQAHRLGADAVVLLGELDGDAIPEDPTEPLPATARLAAAVFIVFAGEGDGEERGPVPGVLWGGKPGRGRDAWKGLRSSCAR